MNAATPDSSLLSRYQLLDKHFGLPEIQSDESLTEDMLFFHLTQSIQYYLNHDFSRLMNILYRIDLDEEKVGAILEMTLPSSISSCLAEEIMLRTKEKMASRAKYRMRSEGN